MKFGKEFRIHLEETLPDWRDKFLCYKPLKKLLKNIPNHHRHHPPPINDAPFNHVDDADADTDAANNNNGNNNNNNNNGSSVEEWFVRILDEELEKINDFYIDKEEDFVIRLQELKERIEKVRERGNGNEALKSENEFNEEMLEFRKAFVSIHGEMVLLKNYSSLNFAGIVKILKKYDKRTGGLLRLPFTQRALHQPFFATEPLTRLVKECEANLELLFPLEAEITESTSEHHVRNVVDPNRRESSVGNQEANLEVYRSTLAAMRAIQGLRRASSTYNPLSLAQFFNDQDDEDVCGAVTAESSVSNSPTSTVNESEE